MVTLTQSAAVHGEAVLSKRGILIMTTLDELVDTFELLGDWDQRYQYLIELGEQMAEMPEEYKTEGNKVRGCMSQVWLQAYCDPADERRVRFHADCDTSIIKGVLSLLIQLADGKRAPQIEELDVDQFFDRLDLAEHLSPNRHVGIYAIVEMMKQQARKLDASRQVA